MKIYDHLNFRDFSGLFLDFSELSMHCFLD